MPQWRSRAPAIPICSAPICTAVHRASWVGHHRYRRTSSLHESWDWESDVYDMPAEIDVRAEGPLRIITLNRPQTLNSVNDNLHVGLARLWPRLTDDPNSPRGWGIFGRRRFLVSQRTVSRCRFARQNNPRRARDRAGHGPVPDSRGG